MKMRKWLMLLSILVLTTSYAEARSGYEKVNYLSFKYGLTSISEKLSLDQHSFSLDFIGEVGHDIKPKLDLTYVNIDKEWGVDSLFQVAFGAFKKSHYGYSNIFPYFYGQLGYEIVNNSRIDFDNSAFFQFGTGLEIPISDPSDNLHIITEFRVMALVGSGDGQDSEIALFLGLRLPIGNPFSYYAPSSGEVDGYAEFEESTISVQNIEIEDTKKAIPINKSSLFADSDGDGVKDSSDICPNTPLNTAVNSVGCPIRDDKLRITPSFKTIDRSYQKTANTFKRLPTIRKVLNVHFELNSAVVANDSKVIIREFVEATNNSKYSSILIEGYTDNTGNYNKNIELSKRRAEAVKTLMIQYGVDSDKIKAVGKGPLNPIATNETEIGRAKNRRIEIVVK